MRHFQPRLALRVLFVLVAIALMLAGPASLSAQRRKPVPSPSGKPPAADTTSQPPQLRSADQAQLEMSVLMSRRTLVTDLERERRRLATQLAQDLEQLEQINTEKLVPLSTTASPDYRNLAQASAELKARATRIKFYSPLALIDKTGEKVRYEPDASQLGAMLGQLCRMVTKLVSNPVFQISGPQDAEQRSVAAHDLDGIIKLSEAINKISRRLSKPLVASR